MTARATGAEQRRPPRLPPNIAKRGLAVDEAAEYCGVSASQLRAQGPKPLRIGRRCVWDIRDLDRWLDALHNDSVSHPVETPEEEALRLLREHRAKRRSNGERTSPLPALLR